MGVGQGMAAESIPGHIVKKITEEIDGGTYRTLQEWEQERRAPSGAARTLSSKEGEPHVSAAHVNTAGIQ